jgi:hypothetical protein
MGAVRPSSCAERKQSEAAHARRASKGMVLVTPAPLLTLVDIPRISAYVERMARCGKHQGSVDWRSSSVPVARWGGDGAILRACTITPTARTVESCPAVLPVAVALRRQQREQGMSL